MANLAESEMSHTVNIRIPDKSSFGMVDLHPVVEWSGNQMASEYIHNKYVQYSNTILAIRILDIFVRYVRFSNGSTSLDRFTNKMVIRFQKGLD